MNNYLSFRRTRDNPCHIQVYDMHYVGSIYLMSPYRPEVREITGGADSHAVKQWLYTQTGDKQHGA